MASRFVVRKASNGKFHFVLKATNGETILQSQMYAAMADCTAGIDSVRMSAQSDERFRRLDSRNGEPYFTLTAANGQVVGQSEMYSSARARDNGIESVKKNAPQAVLDDQSAV
ncbi:MAG: DUF1508 domain-containing protein [Burkholderiaceae bacterium]|nr:DUF1508 domain-containing protein [Burkholderiaceae bacterium]